MSLHWGATRKSRELTRWWLFLHIYYFWFLFAFSFVSLPLVFDILLTRLEVVRAPTLTSEQCWFFEMNMTIDPARLRPLSVSGCGLKMVNRYVLDYTIT